MLFPFQKDETCAIESEEQKITEPFAAEHTKEVTRVGETSTAHGVMGLLTETGEGFPSLTIYILSSCYYVVCTYSSLFFFACLRSKVQAWS